MLKKGGMGLSREQVEQGQWEVGSGWWTVGGGQLAGASWPFTPTGAPGVGSWQWEELGPRMYKLHEERV
jgi:hypothetical protein